MEKEPKWQILLIRDLSMIGALLKWSIVNDRCQLGTSKLEEITWQDTVRKEMSPIAFLVTVSLLLLAKAYL